METSKKQFSWRFVLGAIALVAIWYFFIQPGSTSLDGSEQTALLQLARQQLRMTASGEGRVSVNETTLPARLVRPGSAYVTLTVDGELRGCMIDAFESHEPLYQNVLRNTILAATADERFNPVGPEEVDGIRISISVLSPTETVAFDTPDELMSQLRPTVDGVILSLDGHLSAYLPEVWETFPDPGEFLSHLSEKAGLPSDRWRQAPYPTIETYRTFRFAEAIPGT